MEIHEGNIADAREEILDGADVNERWGELHMTPLFLAALEGHTELVQLLLERGADPNSVDDLGFTPLIGAAEGGHTEIAAALVEHGAAVNVKNKAGYNPLGQAAGFAPVELTLLLLENGADIELRGPDGISALALAAEKGKTDVVELLLEKGADIDARDQLGRTPIGQASAFGNLETVELLVRKGADVNETDPKEIRPLLLAVEKERYEIAKFLVENGADIAERTVADHSSFAESQGIAKALIAEKQVEVGDYDAARASYRRAVGYLDRSTTAYRRTAERFADVASGIDRENAQRQILAALAIVFSSVTGQYVNTSNVRYDDPASAKASAAEYRGKADNTERRSRAYAEILACVKTNETSDSSKVPGCYTYSVSRSHFPNTPSPETPDPPQD